jgi:hypothetical protein
VTDSQANETIEQRAKRIVEQEVYLNISGLVSTLASAPDLPDHRGLQDLCNQAVELCAPVLDYEEAATQAGWTGPHKDKYNATYFEDTTDGMTWCCKDWRELCEAFDIEPYEREVFEHWAVSQWLGKKLESKGERIDFDFQGLVVWARTTTGQGIASDRVIEQIAQELSKA